MNQTQIELTFSSKACVGGQYLKIDKKVSVRHFESPQVSASQMRQNSGGVDVPTSVTPNKMYYIIPITLSVAKEIPFTIKCVVDESHIS